MVSSYDYFSHPNFPLKEHLKAVGKLSRSKAWELGIRSENLLKTIEVIGSFHDVGKYSLYFQEYLWR